MMTANLRTYSLGKLRDEDTIGKAVTGYRAASFSITIAV